MPSALVEWARQKVREEAEQLKQQNELVSNEDFNRYVKKNTGLKLRQEVRKAIKSISICTGPHQDLVWEAAGYWSVREFGYKMDDDDKVMYLRTIGFAIEDVHTWANSAKAQFEPYLKLEIDSSPDKVPHVQHLGHTWYLVSCVLGNIGGARSTNDQWAVANSTPNMYITDKGEKQLVWTSPRRLNQIRESLFEFVAEDLGKTYKEHFQGTPFAQSYQTKNTGDKVRKWLAKLVDLINARKVSPSVVVRTILFFRGFYPKNVATDDQDEHLDAEFTEEQYNLNNENTMQQEDTFRPPWMNNEQTVWMEQSLITNGDDYGYYNGYNEADSGYYMDAGSMSDNARSGQLGPVGGATAHVVGRERTEEAAMFSGGAGPSTMQINEIAQDDYHMEMMGGQYDRMPPDESYSYGGHGGYGYGDGKENNAMTSREDSNISLRKKVDL